ncbi:MAG: ABC transporter ATP-binding protein [Candidatus Omnitrophica bacterium]|nr:ABC transporter ATP-binding protein [Candidatus Omnitrophota bacterium]
MIETRDVWKEYRMGSVTLQVLKGVTLSIDAHAFVAIVGPSGAGKSTLLHLLAGLDTPTKGAVLWDGVDVSKLGDGKRSAFRNRQLGIVFQFYHLLPELSALENVMLPALIGAQRGRRALRARAGEQLSRVGLSERARHRPRELSGGEQQRVAIARALMNQPQVLFCDEPTGNLDSTTGAEVMELLIGIHQCHRVGLVVVTHQMKLAEAADRVIVLQDGRMLEAQTAKR